jgi:cation diffusion facilitator CzcD-associated flavoprotein CzcO
MYQWAVIGAGPAGIASVGKLIDHGIPPKDIAWIDPNFTVGDFGTHWRNVPSNTKVDLFLKFLHASDAFKYKDCNQDFELNSAPGNKTCHLRLMSDPLQWVTDHLQKEVSAFQEVAQNLHLAKRVWNIQLKNSEIAAKNVVLAIGSEPKTLPYSSPEVVSLQDAMDHERIKKHCGANDTVAVFGSSHSSILVLRNLLENSVKKVINFYRLPLLYAVYLDDWILFDDTGLKGPTAEWARAYIDGEMPANLERFYASEDNINHHLPLCNKVIYSVGFERRTLPTIQGMGPIQYMEQSGIIAPGLFGFGIAFPEAKMNPLGAMEYRVGLWKFMEYLCRIMPVWLKYSA